jgi:hypothetical protein
MSDIKPFDPSIPKDEIDRLFRKLADTRLPETPIVPDAGDNYGTFIPPFPSLALSTIQLIHPQDPLSPGLKSSTTTGSTPSPGPLPKNKSPNGITTPRKFPT